MSEAVVKLETQQVPMTVVQSESAALISLIERAARDPSVDVNKMERLFDMQERAAKRHAEAAFSASMAAAQAETEIVARNKRNEHTKSNYTDLAAVSEAVQPVIAKHGFGLSFGTVPCDREDFIRMCCEVMHAGGHTKRFESDIPIDLAGSQGKVNKTAVQAFGSTTTYGRRYMMCMVFNIATADNDGNAHKRKSAAESKRDGTSERFNAIKQQFENAGSLEELGALSREHQDEINEMPDRWASILSDAWDLRRDELKARGG